MKLLIVLFALVISSQAFSYGLGFSSYPLAVQQKLISGEVTGIFSDTEENSDGGVGFQGRYTQKITNRVVADGGFGLASGDRSSRIFAGLDYEFFPDYMNQPRVSLKATFERAKEIELTRNLLTFSPTVTKGFKFWGYDAYPFAALPVGLSLESENNTYLTTIGANLGVMGGIPLEGMEKFSARIEYNIDLKDYYNGVFFALAYSL